MSCFRLYFCKHFKLHCMIWLRVSLVIRKPLCLLFRTFSSNFEAWLFVCFCIVAGQLLVNKQFSEDISLKDSSSMDCPATNRRTPLKIIPKQDIPQTVYIPYHFSPSLELYLKKQEKENEKNPQSKIITFKKWYWRFSDVWKESRRGALVKNGLS